MHESLDDHVADPNHPTISVIVPVKDDQEGLARLLNALLASPTETPPFEVIVVDNGSCPPIASVEDPRVTILREETPGAYAARNAGIRRARGEILAFTDADAVPAPDWLARGAAMVQPGEVMLVAGRVEIQVSEAAHPFEYYELVRYLDQETHVRDEGFGATANLFTNRATVEAIGAFDATLHSGGDVEWGRRVGAAGGGVLYAPSVAVGHPARASWSAGRARMQRVAEGRAELVRRGTLPKQRLHVQRLLPPVRMITRAWTDEKMANRTLTERLRMVVGLTGGRYLGMWARHRARREVKRSQ